MKTAWKSLIVVGIVAVIPAGLVAAGPGGGRRGMGPGPQGRGPAAGQFGPQAGGLGPIIRQLDLTEEQLDKIHDILQERRTDAVKAERAVADAREALHDAVTSGSDEAKIRAAGAALGEAIGNQAALRAKTLVSIKATLTEEQQKTFGRFMERRPLGPGGMRGQGFGGRLGRGRRAGPVQPEEMGPGRGGRPADRGPMALEQMFKAADANEDGTLTMDELQAYRGARRDARRP